MAGTVLWVGLTMIEAMPLLPLVGGLLPWTLFGALVMFVGAIMLLLKK